MLNKVKDTAENAGANLPFEEAMKRLEVLADEMEHEDLPMEALIAKYEEGTRLAQSCMAQLQAAEVKIQELEKNQNGQFVIKPLSPAPVTD